MATSSPTPHYQHIHILLLHLFFFSFVFLASTICLAAAATTTTTTHTSITASSSAAAALPTYVFAFGDSNTDTGNSPIADPADDGDVLRYPFGMTWPGEGAGRRCDGRLVIDWLCLLAFGGSLLPPHLGPSGTGSGGSGSGGSGPSGQNYAVSGSAALDPRALEEVAGLTSSTPDSLDVQAGWFEAGAVYGVDRDGTSLVFFGENGGNDLHFALREGRPDDFIRARLMPSVIAAMTAQLDRILSVDLGPAPITRVVIQGQFPIGCLPSYVIGRRAQRGSAPSDFDDLGCVSSVNAISDLQNQLIRSDIIPAVSARHPSVSIVFLDSSAAFRYILAHAPRLGFYNLIDTYCYDATGATHCWDPWTYIGWDGVHMTDAVNRALVDLFLHGAQNSNASFSHPFPSFLTSFANSV